MSPGRRQRFTAGGGQAGWPSPSGRRDALERRRSHAVGAVESVAVAVVRVGEGEHVGLGTASRARPTIAGTTRGDTIAPSRIGPNEARRSGPSARNAADGPVGEALGALSVLDHRALGRDPLPRGG